MKGSLLVLLAAALALPSAALAFVRTKIPDAPNSCLYWESREIRWSAANPLGGNLQSQEALEALRLSFDEWERHGCSDLRFREGSSVAREVGYNPRGSNANTVLFRDQACRDVAPRADPCHASGDCSRVYDCWDHDASLIAVTTTTFSPCSGRIVDADVEFNGGFFFTTADGHPCAQGERGGCVSTDVRNTMVHEIGHMIGLDHSPVPGATMKATAPHGELEKRDLAADDIQGLCTIYPAGEPVRRCPPARPLRECGESLQGPPEGGCASAAGGLAMATLLLPAYFLTRRRSQG